MRRETPLSGSPVSASERCGSATVGAGTPLGGLPAHRPDSVASTERTQPPRPDGYAIGSGPFSHGQCGRWWTGVTIGHCGQCHQEFSSGAFDRHQHIRDGILTCDTTGLTPHIKPYGTLWKRPGDDHWTNFDLPDEGIGA